MNDQNIKPRTYTVRGFELAFNIGHTTVYKLIGEGKLRTAKIGRRTLILADSAEELINGTTKAA
jgi:excisionase family DNA binding protein